METVLDRKILKLKSNGGIRRKSNRTGSLLPPTGNFSIKGIKIFPIYLDEQDADNILIFARGHRIVKKNHLKLSQLVNQLNKGDSVTFASLKQLMEPLWDAIEINSFIQDLLIIEAIKLDNVTIKT
ncbi:MAG: hypothetical protein JKY48_10065 [Flavobacteriales bacterium]|nr:hypothetical protein [Flavobacteriales bacterium]